MPKFINTRLVDTVNSITEYNKKRFENPFNVLSDQKPFILTYFNQNVENTTLDEATNSEYAHIGAVSGIKFNRINNCVVLGGSQLQLDLDITDFGLASNELAGEATVLPNTFKPYSNDFFYINHLGHQYYFKVNNVNVDTMPNGSNYYKISFEYDKLDYNDAIEKQVVNRYNMIVNNVGTEYTAVIKEEIYDLIDTIENVTYNLKKFFYDVFFREKLQTFVYTYNEYYFYDPCMIEFLKKNDIYSDEDFFVVVNHELPRATTFSIEYMNTYLCRVEQRNIHKQFSISPVGKLIDNKASIFMTRYEQYYEIKYNDAAMGQSVPTVDVDLTNRCIANELYSNDSTMNYRNIIIKYFNNTDFDSTDIDNLININFRDNIEIFYDIPVILYILNRFKNEQIKRK